MKKVYGKPMMSVESFVTNEFIAACWKIKCNVPSGIGYVERNGEPGYQKGSWFEKGDKFLAEGKGCGTYHNGVAGVPDGGPRANAMWQPTDILGRPKGSPYEVYHWSTGSANTSQHFSKVADAEWEENRNAS